jgi:hypothetical protein
MRSSGYRQVDWFGIGVIGLVVILLTACQATQSGGVRDYSQGIEVAVAETANNPAYRITETPGAVGYGYAYLLEKSDGRWRMRYDSYDPKAFAKRAGDNYEVPVGSEVLWTDGKQVVVYFGTEPLRYSREDGSFPCPANKQEPGHRACRSQFTKAKSLFGGSNKDGSRALVLDFEEIQQAVEDTGIVKTTEKRMALDNR